MTVKRWTSTELDELKARYPHERTRTLAASMGRAVSAVYSKVNELGLKKTAEAKRLYGGRDNLEKGAAYRFKSGQKSWNTGTHFDAGGRSSETRFSAGHKPHTAVPVGTVVKSFEGYWKRKVAENAPRGLTRRNWVWVHRELWEQHYGPVPAGCSVRFLNGNPDDIRIENLELVHRRELMRQNTVHNLPPELVQVVRLRSQVVRKINEREGKHEKRDRRSQKPSVRDAGGAERPGQPDGT